jgi:hypothetical protein
MNEQEVSNKFQDIIQPKIINRIVREKRPPSKFPELRYLWGMTLLGSFILMIVSATISTLLESV